MGRTRDNSGQDPLKAVKNNQTGDILTRLLMAFAAILFTFSISLAAYSTFRTSMRPAFLGESDPGLQTMADQTRPTNISHLAFGIGGSIRTWETRGRYSDLWWRPNLTRGFVFLEQRPAVHKSPFRIPHRVSSEWRGFRRSAGSESAVRIARVVVDLFRVGMPGVRWFVMGDDDTVFFPNNVVAVLGKYDHRGTVYVGGNSESVEQDVAHGYDMAFGGGGFAISYSLAEQLAGKMDGCLNRYHYLYGSDERVRACVGEIGVVLTRESGFHQNDIRGNPFGLLAAHPLAPLVSLHHLDDVEPLFPNRTQLDSVKALMNAHDLDPARTLQQCFCYHRSNKWSVSVSWGYAVQIFPATLTATELETPQLTFRTWRTWRDGPFTFNTRPVGSDPCGKPAVFYLDWAEVVGPANGTLTVYGKLPEERSGNCGSGHPSAAGLRSVVVSAPRMDAQQWTQMQRPRRPCCRIKEGIENPTMRIQIHKCRDSESITI